MRGKRYLLGGILGVVLLAATAFLAEEIFAGEEQDQILSGVYVGDVYVGGDTKEGAMEKLTLVMSQKGEEKITLNIDQQTCEFPLGELGVTFSYEDALKEACAYGKSGNLIKRFKEQEDAKTSEVHFYPEYKVDDAVFESLITAHAGEWFHAPQNATICKNETGLQILEGVVGTACDMKATKERFHTFIAGDFKYGATSFDLSIMESRPEITKEDLGQVDFKVLGSFSTYIGSSDWNRKQNMKNATDFINGTVLMPGEEFNTSRTIMPFSRANGYYDAGAFSNGEVVKSIGGGVCQVSTTLYNAVLLSELEVVQRFPHSMTVGYVQLSADAAISGEAKNFIFKNNTDTPVYIEGSYTESQLTFKIYGKETRPANRTLEFKNQIVSVIHPPAEIVTIDPNQPVGYRKVTQGAYTGYKVNLYKYIYEDGKLVGTELVNSSSYSAQPARVIEGGAPAEETAQTPAEPPAESSAESSAEPPTEPSAPVEVPASEEPAA